MPGASPQFMKAAVDHFADTGEWPSDRLLQNVLAERGDGADARREAKRLRGRHGRWSEGTVIVSVRGMYEFDSGDRLLDDFVTALRLAVHLYKRGDKHVEATVSYRDLIAREWFDEERARRCIAMLESESLVTDTGADHEVRTISPRIRHFLKIRDIEGYVAKARRIDRGRRLKRLAKAPLRWFRGPEATVATKICVGVLILVIGSLVLAAILWGLGELGRSEGEDRAPPRADETSRSAPAARQPRASRRSAAARSGG